MPKPAVAYICNNLDFQDNYTQRKLISKFASERDYKIEKWFEDTVEWENRFNTDRPQLLDLYEWINTNYDKTIIMVGVGRISIDFNKFIELQTRLNERNIQTAYIDCDLSLNEDEQNLYDLIEAALSKGDSNYDLTRNNE